MIMESADVQATAREVEVTITSAKGLRDAENARTTDPYCVVEALGSQSRFQTKTLQSTVNPVWEETGKLIVSRNGVVKVTIYDSDGGRWDEALGCVEIPSESFASGSFEGSLPLQDTKDAKAKVEASLQVSLQVLQTVQASNIGSAVGSAQGNPAALAVPPTLLQTFPDLAMVLPDPFSLTTVPRTLKPEEKRPSSTAEANHLIEAYHRLLDQLLEAQESIEVDQERMAWGLLQAKQAQPPDHFLDMQALRSV
ncbi:DOC2B [Symbiodinium natans]|uniref:DOC2B protein n=1 Tax=Symbiodinium natans TaxID=878477 RepID=A0A812GWS0_9DINO|nr:DOC2B [Symbiodinium natans]